MQILLQLTKESIEPQTDNTIAYVSSSNKLPPQQMRFSSPNNRMGTKHPVYVLIQES